MSDCSVVEILIVEDNPEDAELIVRALRKRHLANEVFIVEDGSEALDFLFGRGAHAGRAGPNKPKVIFLDLKLPKVSGLEALKKIKADASTRTIPVVIITSSKEDPDIQAAYDSGANSYVVKPVEFEAFLGAMDHTGYYRLLINQPVQ